MITIRRNVTRRKIIPLVLSTIFILSMCIQISNQSNSFNTNVNSTNTDNTPMVSQNDYETPIIGQGNDREVYIYMQNQSTSQGVDDFNITNDADDYFLNNGVFNFTMDKNYLTNFTVEDDNSLEYYRRRVPVTVASDDFSVVRGTNVPEADYISYNSITDGVEIVESNVSIDVSTYTPAINTILGFQVVMEIQCGVDLTLETSLYNYVSTAFDLPQSEVYVQHISSSFRTVSFYLRNENLHNVNSTKNMNLNFQFSNDSTSFNILINSLEVRVIQGHETAIQNNSPVALEFELRGDSTVYGFQSWIRALDVEDSVTSNLTIQLVAADQSEVVPRSQLLDPDNTELLATPGDVVLAEISYLDYSFDKPQWIDFTDDNSGVDLDVGNYFIIISANTSNVVGEKRFSLINIPWSATVDPSDPDNKIDHLLLKNVSNVWTQVTADELSTNNFPKADAANFAINLTRAYLPSEINLEIDGKPVNDAYIWDYPHDELDDSDPNVAYYASYWWGYGSIDVIFDEPIPTVLENFTVELNWDESIYSGSISFSVSYDVQKFYIESVATTYTLEVEVLPYWNVSLDFDATNSRFTHWNFSKLSYLIPDNWVIEDIEDSTSSILNSAQETGVKDDFKYTIFNSSIIDHSDNYTLLAHSPNYMRAVNTFLNIAGENQWLTNGFMQNDDIALSVGLLTDENKYLENYGEVSALLYDVDGELVPASTLSDSTLDDNSTYSWFDFEQTPLLETDGTTELGTYTAILNWTNGDQAGIKMHKIYVNQYASTIHKLNVLESTHVNQLIGTVNAFSTDLGDYDISIYAVKPLTETPDSFILNETRNSALGSNLYLTNYALNETLLNANEEVHLVLDLENRHLTLDYNVSITVNLVYALNHDSSIVSTAESVLISKYGTADESDKQQVDLIFTVPDVLTGGENCPIRNMPMQIKLTTKIDDTQINERVESQYLYYSELAESEFEGRILTVKNYADRTGPSFTANIERSLLDLPGDVVYFAQVYNDYYMAMVNEVNFTSENNKIFGIFEDLAVSQSPIDHFATQTFSGSIINENSDILKNTELEFFFDSRENVSAGNEQWESLIGTEGVNTIVSDDEGKFSFEFNMSLTPRIPEVSILVKFAGNATYFSFNSTYTLIKNTYESSIEITLDTNPTLIRNEHNLISGSIRNTGNSTLKNISITIFSDYGAEINLLDGLTFVDIEAGETVQFQVDFFDSNYKGDTVSVSVNVSAIVKESGLPINQDAQFDFNTYRTNVEGLRNLGFVLLFIAGAVVLWIFGAKYMKTKINEINSPLIEEEVSKSKKSKRKGGKYVSVSDLSIKQEKSKDVPDEGTSLDDLLDEEE